MTISRSSRLVIESQMTTPINITVPHTLGADKAADRLKQLGVPGMFVLKEVELKWTANVGFTETISANIHGTLKITDSEVTLQTDTPLPDFVDRRIGESIKARIAEALK
jgi:hypothetical protein